MVCKLEASSDQSLDYIHWFHHGSDGPLPNMPNSFMLGLWPGMAFFFFFSIRINGSSCLLLWVRVLNLQAIPNSWNRKWTHWSEIFKVTFESPLSDEIPPIDPVKWLQSPWVHPAKPPWPAYYCNSSGALWPSFNRGQVPANQVEKWKLPEIKS